MSEEIELKLEADPDALAALEASGLLPGEPAIVRQRAVYFDTPDHGLARAGLALRIRHAGGRRVQTVKAGSGASAGLFARAEWERAVDSDTPILDDTLPVRPLIEAAGTIGPVFEVRVERRRWIVQQDGASVELVIDRGEVAAGNRTSPICEIELELMAGQPAALFALARRIDSTAPVRLGVQSKAERGYLLLEGAPAKAFKAEPVALAGDVSAAQAFQQIVQACVRQFRLNEAALPERRAATLHQARVALRRMRAAFAIFKPVIDGPEARRLKTDLRWLAAECAPARDLDVLLERAAAHALRDRIAPARETAYDRAQAALASARARALLLDLAEWSATGAWLEAAAAKPEPAADFAVAALDRLWRTVEKGGRKLARADDEARHAFRKTAKKLRYAAEFLGPLFGRERQRRRYRKFLRRLGALLDTLGALNDLATAPRIVQELGLSGDPRAAALLADGEKAALLAAATEARAALLDSKRFWRG